MKIIRTVPLMTILCVTALGQGDGPPNGYVPDEKTAVAVAEAVLSPVYGSKHIKHERPFKAALNNGVWRVSGTLNCGKLPAGTICVGGTAVVEIQKSDGRIISMVHHK